MQTALARGRTPANGNVLNADRHGLIQINGAARGE
jgi:hypothetical protein